MRSRQPSSTINTGIKLRHILVAVLIRTFLTGCVLALPLTGLTDHGGNPAINHPGDHTGDHTEDKVLEVITVSATPITINEAGSSVSVITREDILSRNATTLQALLREIPGLAVSQSGSGGGVTHVRIRGAEANQVSVLIDGIEANDLSQDSAFDFSTMLTTDIQRIEVVRGPQSALWGSDAMAGVVHIITQSGETSPGTDVGITAGGGSFGTIEGTLFADHRTARTRTRLGIGSMHTDGTNIARSGNEDDGYRNNTINLTGRYQLARSSQVSNQASNQASNQESTLSFSLRHSRVHYDYDGIAGGIPVDRNNRTRSEFLYAGVSLEQNINDWTSHHLRLARSDTDNQHREVNDTNVVERSSAGTRDSIHYQWNTAWTAHQISVLAEHETETFRQRGEATSFGDPNQNRYTNTRSLALEYRYNGDQINFSASARRDNNSDFGNGDSWRLTGNWQAGKDATILFASIGESLKNPTFTERFGFFTNFIGNPGLIPEESLGWELGIKQSWPLARLNMNLTWFDADLTNEINGSVTTAGGDYTATNSNGESNREGLELIMAWTPTDRLKLSASYTWLDATEQDQTGRNITEIRRPEHSGAMGATFTRGRGSVHLAVSHTGTQEDDFFGTYPGRRVKLAPFTLVHLSGRYQLTPDITLTGKLENITDEHYEQVFGYVSPGFGAYLGIGLRW